jgi:hypothetical protein
MEYIADVVLETRLQELTLFYGFDRQLEYGVISSRADIDIDNIIWRMPILPPLD